MLTDPYQILLTIVLLLLFALTVRVETRVLALGGFPFISFVGAYYFLFHGAISSYVGANVDHLPFPREISYETFAYSAAFAGAVVAGFVIGFRLPFGALSRSDNLGVSRGKSGSLPAYRPDFDEYSFFVLCVSSPFVVTELAAAPNTQLELRLRNTLVLGIVR